MVKETGKDKVIDMMPVLPFGSLLTVVLSFTGVFLSDKILNISHTLDAFLTVPIVAFSLSGFVIAVSTLICIFLNRRSKLNVINCIILSLVLLTASTLLSAAIYVQCDTIGLEYLSFSEPEVMVENLLKGLYTSIIPSQACFWLCATSFMLFNKRKHNEAKRDSQI